MKLLKDSVTGQETYLGCYQIKDKIAITKKIGKNNLRIEKRVRTGFTAYFIYLK